MHSLPRVQRYLGALVRETQPRNKFVMLIRNDPWLSSFLYLKNIQWLGASTTGLQYMYMEPLLPPTALMPLLEYCSVRPDAAVSNHRFFGPDAEIR